VSLRIVREIPKNFMLEVARKKVPDMSAGFDLILVNN
jgi:hypothetical protein|tara:strand:- start:4427 stop:4537 length:111 start_codon:yes stop_codon:yes gene_type:complete